MLCIDDTDISNIVDSVYELAGLIKSNPLVWIEGLKITYKNNIYVLSFNKDSISIYWTENYIRKPFLIHIYFEYYIKHALTLSKQLERDLYNFNHIDTINYIPEKIKYDLSEFRNLSPEDKFYHTINSSTYINNLIEYNDYIKDKSTELPCIRFNVTVSDDTMLNVLNEFIREYHVKY